MRPLITIVFCSCLALSCYGQAPGGAHPPGGPPPGSRPPGPPPPPPPSGGANGGSSTTPGAAPRTQSVTSSTGVKLGPPGRWWDEQTFIKTIAISKVQQHKMDSVFDANKQAILDTYKSFEAEQAKLQAISKATPVDQAKMFAAIDSVNQARAALQKANTQMLLQIRAQLAADQLAKLDSLP
jgi:Spy/CpxP family protein refolding chaperone